MVNSGIASRWRELSGEKGWNGLLRPLDLDLRRYSIHYDERASSVGDAYNINNKGQCPKEEFFAKAGLEKGNDFKYNVTHYFHGGSVSVQPAWFGFVAVATDEGKAVLGRRDILIAWMGTISYSEWPDSAYNKTSARDQVRDALRELMNKYQNEEVNITVVGFSLGGALATLNAMDIAANGYNIKPVSIGSGEKKSMRMVTAFAYGCPRVGNDGLEKEFKRLVDHHRLHRKTIDQGMITGGATARFAIGGGVNEYVSTHNMGVYLRGIAGDRHRTPCNPGDLGGRHAILATYGAGNREPMGSMQRAIYEPCRNREVAMQPRRPCRSPCSPGDLEDEQRVLRLRLHKVPKPHPLIEENLQEAGFWYITFVRDYKLVPGLISALIERWRPETHTFHLPCGECTITLEDVAMQLGVQTNGMPVVMSHDLIRWTNFATCFLGKRPYHQSVKGGGQYSWGSAILAFLYREMCKASLVVNDNNTVEIGGCLLLLQSWAWHRLPFLTPISRTAMEAKIEGTGLVHNNIKEFRLKIDIKAKKEFNWRPYMNEELFALIPHDILDGFQYWCAVTPLINFAFVEIQFGDRVLRQFHFHQPIPRSPWAHDLLQNLDGRRPVNWVETHDDLHRFDGRRKEALIGLRSM
ncbi:hypothetical protein F3Y22_tig00009023pilonHSYRG00147 [Hibiscus syriacus]|uniref:Uncharacterized protein n=1 Tax=Hibiscus syriacus TaxID=106335 RepID=A0A6A3C6W4_HIBSY|nr:hypothetical protein F3Y22_tig00009023pilonHSYRG00147 [Hibiscus syriacus]